MRGIGRLSLELLFVALLYSAVGVVLNVFSGGQGDAWGILRLLVVSYLALLPVAWFVARVDGTWWSVGGTATFALALLQTVVPRMELLLERDSSLYQLPWTALNALGTAVAGATALMMVLRPWQNGGALPPYPWPAGAPRSYSWRIPAAVAVYAVVHVLAARVGRALFGQSTQPALAGELPDKVALGFLVILAVFAIAAHLGVRSRTRMAILLSTVALIPAIGRWQALANWPLGYLSTRIGLRLAADLLVASLAATLLLRRLRGKALPGEDLSDEAPLAPDSADDNA